MNQKWKTIIGICLVVMVCVPIVSAAIQIPTTKSSYWPSLWHLKVAKNTPYTFEDNDFIAIPDNRGESESIRSIFEKYRTSGTSPQSGTYISKEEAVQIALGVFPGITLTKPIETATRYVDCKGIPLKRMCIIVTLIGYNPEEYPETSPFLVHENGTIGGRLYNPYGGMVYIDAITGEVLFVAYLI